VTNEEILAGLRARLVEMRATLIDQLAVQIDASFLHLLSSVQVALVAIDAIQDEHSA
jgi:hypothetical protein